MFWDRDEALRPVGIPGNRIGPKSRIRKKRGYFVSNGNFYCPEIVQIRCQTESGNIQTAHIAKKARMVVCFGTRIWRESSQRRVSGRVREDTEYQY